jgi:sugar-specific transcriptional regulator TrmB
MKENKLKFKKEDDFYKLFSQIGIKKNQEKIYLTLLKFGALKISELVKKTGIQRSYIYDILDQLTDKGMVGSYLKNNIKIYFADDPKKILDIIKQKEEEFKNYKLDYLKLLPILENKKNSMASKDNVLVYTGLKGIKNIFKDMLQIGKDFICFGGEGELSKYFPIYVNTFVLNCKKRNMKYKMIYSNCMREERPLKIQHKNKISEIRFISDNYNFPFAIYVYGETTAIIIWKSQIAIQIKSKDTTKGFRNYFNVIWNASKSI